MKVKEIYQYLDNIAPFFTACDFDNCGLIVGDMNQDIQKIGLALDITNDVIDKAINEGVNLIITHHPVIFNPIKKIEANTLVFRLIQNNISTIAVHTNLDKAIGGVNDTLIKYYNLTNISSPSQLDDLARMGELENDTSVFDYAKIIKQKLNSKVVRFYDSGKKVKRVCYVSGGGGSMLKDAFKLGIDTFITGDIKHDQFVDAKNAGINLIEANHFDSEIVVLNPLREKLDSICGDVKTVILQSENFVDIV